MRIMGSGLHGRLGLFKRACRLKVPDPASGGIFSDEDVLTYMPRVLCIQG